MKIIVRFSLSVAADWTFPSGDGRANQWRGRIMKNRIIGFAALAAIALAPVGAYAQGIERGAAQGADEGGRDAGPVGAVVGGAVGAATGAVGGLLGVDQRPRFHEYVRREHVRS